jgi:hypothetical protein
MQSRSQYTVMDHSALAEQQLSLIRHTSEVLFVTMNEAGCLLRQYGWKAKLLQSEWFADDALQKKIRERVGVTDEGEAVAVGKTEMGSVQCQSAYCEEVVVEDSHGLGCGHACQSRTVQTEKKDAHWHCVARMCVVHQ